MAQPNDALDALLTESRMSWAGLVRRINDLGATEGLALRYDYTAVNRWVKRGERPRQPVPALIARALSERLGRRVSPSEFGMLDTDALATRGLDYADSPTDAVTTIVDLGKADTKPSKVFIAPFMASAFGTPSRDWLLATLDETFSERGAREVGMRQVAGIREMFAVFQEMDVMRGGGHGRTALVEYMRSYVFPLLKKEHASEVRAALFQAAAEQAYLVGWMAYDDGEHGLAQRYLIQALRLAQESGDSALGAHVLAGMSDQANLLGYPREAASLARAGRRGLDLSRSKACGADLLILESRALAAQGDNKAAVKAVSKAEALFEQVEPSNEPEWARFIDKAYLYGEAANSFRDLGHMNETERFAQASIADATTQGRARRAALSHAAIAVNHVHRGEVEAAANQACTVVELAAEVNSSRCLDAVRDLLIKLAPHRQIPDVKRFAHEALSLGLSA